MLDEGKVVRMTCGLQTLDLIDVQRDEISLMMFKYISGGFFVNQGECIVKIVWLNRKLRIVGIKSEGKVINTEKYLLKKLEKLWINWRILENPTSKTSFHRRVDF